MTIITVLTIIFGFYMAWNIGANDVSNAMGTSVGSKALTLKKAVIIAAILEFCGAFFLGSHVSNTIQQGIIPPEVFSQNLEIFVIGMLGSLIATGIWLNLASYLRLPVSSTHAIVGAVIGFGAVAGGIASIQWGEVLSIVLSWLAAPLLSGSIAYIVFHFIQRRILFSFRPLVETKKIIPFIVFIAITFFSTSLIYNGLSNLHLNLTFQHALLIGILIGIIAGITAAILVRRIPISSKTKIAASPFQLVSIEKAIKHMQRTKLSSTGNVQQEAENILVQVKELKQKVKKESDMSYLTSDYAKVEKMFVYLQIISASLIAFAHGANDVANAIGPVSAVVEVIQHKALLPNVAIPVWILFLGGIGIVIGLATWGWRVIETIGKKITELTPTRGFSAEFGAAITILIASKMGLPISTTHALVGAILGVGMARGMSALNLKVLRDIVFTWIITIPLSALLSIIIFYILRFSITL